MEAEFGGLPVRFLKPTDVKAYDSEGNEICIPICQHCKNLKTEVIGLKHTCWICCNCVVECDKKEP